MCDSDVSSPPKSPVLCARDDSDTVVTARRGGHNPERCIHRTVLDHDDFQLIVVLLEATRDGTFEKLRLTKAGNDDAHQHLDDHQPWITPDAQIVEAPERAGKTVRGPGRVLRIDITLTVGPERQKHRRVGEGRQFQ